LEAKKGDRKLRFQRKDVRRFLVALEDVLPEADGGGICVLVIAAGAAVLPAIEW
jgi:hypothetical protein